LLEVSVDQRRRLERHDDNRLRPRGTRRTRRNWYVAGIVLLRYEQRLAAHHSFRAWEKGKPEDDGHQRFGCPAALPTWKVKCPLKPASERFDGKVRIQIRPDASLREFRPRACEQQSVMVSPEAGAKFRQVLVFGSPEHRRVYATLRNSVEGMNGFVKDPAYEGVGESGRRRVRGVAAQSILVAFQLLVP
jgi:hypothetical protein